MQNNFVFSWMRQSGLVKKLQLFLALSLVLNLCLAQSILLKRIPANNKANNENKQTLEQINDKPQISHHELKQILEKYLISFFRTDSVSLAYIKSLSSEALFNESISAEFMQRQKLNLNASFKLSDYFIEQSDNQQYKLIALGEEIFPQGNYQNRKIEIELIFDSKSMHFTQISKFQAK